MVTAKLKGLSVNDFATDQFETMCLGAKTLAPNVYFGDSLRTEENRCIIYTIQYLLTIE